MSKQGLIKLNAANPFLASIVPVAIICLYAGLLIWFGIREFFEILGAWTRFRGFHAHGFLMLAITLHVIWRDRVRLQQLSMMPNWWPGWLMMLVSSSIWLASWAMDFIPGQVLGFFLVLVLGVGVVFGSVGFQLISTRLAILLFTLPVWFPLSPVLQSTATLVVEALLNLFGITAYVDGNLVHLPAGVFEIADGCSGLGFLLASLSFGSYIIIRERLNALAGGFVLLVAVVVALASNWLRIFIIIVCGHYYGMDHSLVREHVMFGWLLYGVILLPTFIWGMSCLERYLSIRAPMNEPSFPKLETTYKSAVLGFIVVVGLALIKPSFHYWSETNPKQSHAAEVLLPSDWTQTSDRLTSWSPQFTNLDYSSLNHYLYGKETISIVLAGYYGQPPGSQIVDKVEALVPPGWRAIESGSSSSSYTQVKIQSNLGDRFIVRYWFDIGGRRAASRVDAKLARPISRLQRRNDSALVAFAVQCRAGGCSSAEALLDEVLERL